MLENLINSPFLTSLALTLLHFLWQGVLVAIVLKSALLIFNNNKPQLRYALSALAMLVSLLLPVITFVILYRAELSSANALVNSLALTELLQELKRPDALFSFTELTQTLPMLLPYLSVLWLATITLLAGKLLIEITTVNKLPTQATIAPNDILQARFEELVKQINLNVTPRLLISLKVDVPMAIGWLKPVVLLPASMVSGLNNAQLEMLILHELAHIRRHDYLVNFLQTLVEILLFFHPAVLWISKQMRNEREYCSDDIAVHHCGDPVAYAHTLADTASLCKKVHNHTIPDMAMAASGGDLKQRVIRLVDHHCAPNNNVSKWFASATIIFSVLLLSSKQLLTMPLLDIWYSESPWNETGKTLIEDISHDELLKSKVSNSELSNTSLAQQLLTPQQLASQKKNIAQLNVPAKVQEPVELNAIKSFDVRAKSRDKLSIDSTKKQQIAKANRQITVDENANDSRQFESKLDNLSSQSKNTKVAIEHTVVAKSLMVDEAFERTNSNNSYQQELLQLSSPQQEKASTDINPINSLAEQKIALLQQSSNISEFENKTKQAFDKEAAIDKNTINNAKNAFADISFDNKQEVESDTPIWHNAKQLESARPVYPSVAKRKGIELEVTVNFTIGVDGYIKDIQFDPQNKINYFKSSIRSAIKKWRFLPAKVDEKPVESQMSKVFAFSLQS